MEPVHGIRPRGPPSERQQQQQLLLADAQQRADSRCPLPVTPLTPVAPGVNLNLQYNPAAAAAAGRDAEGGGGGGGGAAARPEVELLGTTLGVGAFGRVVLGAYRGERVAVKILNEVEVLARCQHPNVIRLLAASLNGPRACLVMELMESSLDRMLYGGGGGGGGGGKEPRVLPLPTVLHIALQVAQALAYLHPTIHPASGTTLVTARPEVGTAAYMAPETFEVNNHTITDRVAAYMAPETFEVNNHTITDRVDVYAFGVILWEMLSGCQPWKGMQPVQVAFAISLLRHRLPMDRLPPERCPPRLRGIIEACWEGDPARRPAAAEVMKELLLLQEALAHSRLATVTLALC
ncbi:hypothetical protein GPECTOR_27g646 [Gonium pectorale]|uniref:Protein kinase domain-containing protein n=1 Tax=Gonium pectorale TaxID=33097 RepID=A0A150GF78_GONPE|nr:hypothetical protein GPECTOR_27g646 [Gonium pectorale]|eukprot:KXZ48476.1 hypothetical protein GPECTOR_27g646 [Gonium pectorale]